MILVNSVIMTRRWEAAMPVATPRSGCDLEYYLNRTAGEKTGGYYPNAAQRREPDGRWFGGSLPVAASSAVSLELSCALS